MSACGGGPRFTQLNGLDLSRTLARRLISICSSQTPIHVISYNAPSGLSYMQILLLSSISCNFSISCCTVISIILGVSEKWKNNLKTPRRGKRGEYSAIPILV